MKTVALISRLLLGLIFLVFGLNGFLHFIPMKMPAGPAGQFMGAVFATHYWALIFACQVLGGLLLLIGRYVPLALVILGPVIVNIFFFHVFMAPEGLPLAVIVVILWVIVAWYNRRHLAGILAQRTEEPR